MTESSMNAHFVILEKDKLKIKSFDAAKYGEGL